MHTSVHCLAGTGDFRIFVGDTRGKQVKGDNFAPTTDYSEMDKFLSGAPFDGYAGYVVPRMRRLAACRESCGSGFWGVGVTVLCMGVVAVVGVDVMVVLLMMVYVVAAVVMVIGGGAVMAA
jgi:hypothetical protein